MKLDSLQGFGLRGQHGHRLRASDLRGTQLHGKRGHASLGQLPPSAFFVARR